MPTILVSYANLDSTTNTYRIWIHPARYKPQQHKKLERYGIGALRNYNIAYLRASQWASQRGWEETKKNNEFELAVVMYSA